MTIKNTDRFLKMLRAHGVSQFKSLEIEVSFANVSVPASVDSYVRTIDKSVKKKAPSSQAAPPAKSKIPHHVNEVAALLKLSDADLVDRMFPDPAFPPKDD